MKRLICLILVCWVQEASSQVSDSQVSDSQVPSSQVPETGRCFKAKVIDVHDGDTITVEERVIYRIRLKDVWAPELKTPDGPAARTELMKRLGKGEVTVFIPLIDQTPGKSQTFDRVVGTIYVDGKDINTPLSTLYPKKKKP